MRTRVSVLKKVFLVECIAVFLLLLSKGILLIEKTEVMAFIEKVQFVSEQSIWYCFGALRKGAKFFGRFWTIILGGIFSSFLTTLIIYFIEYLDVKQENMEDFCVEVQRLTKVINEMPYPEFGYDDELLKEIIKEFHSIKNYEKQGKNAIVSSKIIQDFLKSENEYEDEIDAVKQIYHVASEKFDEWLITARGVGNHSHVDQLETLYGRLHFLTKKGNEYKKLRFYSNLLVPLRETSRTLNEILQSVVCWHEEDGFEWFIISADGLDKLKGTLFEQEVHEENGEEIFSCYNKLVYKLIKETNKILSELYKTEFEEPQKPYIRIITKDIASKY